jgi:hypothetical protein
LGHFEVLLDEVIGRSEIPGAFSPLFTHYLGFVDLHGTDNFPVLLDTIAWTAMQGSKRQSIKYNGRHVRQKGWAVPISLWDIQLDCQALWRK